jgi:acyl-coenzyme A synthetase/AMP-(fatty) acid ligase
VKDEQITYTGFSPSYLRILLASPLIDELSTSTLEVIALGGEASSLTDAQALQAAGPQIQVFNRYGPTETTIAVTHAHLTHELVREGVIPIGVPHPNVTFYLIDEIGVLIDGTNEMGELYIGGAQLMAGYWGAPDLTKSVLRTDVVEGETLYRTGDLMSRDERGNYRYAGRIDDVLKRNGVRISLLEMSEAVRSLDQVTAAACLAFERDDGLGVVAFVVTRDPLSDYELQRLTRERLPDSMIPDLFVVVDVLPLTKSGKLDERALLSDAGLQSIRPVR